MLRVGLTGGYASGKSFVAAELERLGCHVIHADDLGHKVLELEGEAYVPTVESFGDGILNSDRTIDRKKLGAIVFNSPELLETLTGIVHPAVFRLENRLIDQFAETDPLGIAVIEAAILIETGRYRWFDRIIVTCCDEETQVRRGLLRDGICEDQVRARMSNQLSLTEKKKYADYIVNTGGEKETTLQQVRAIFRQLQSIARSEPK